jgi:hypothetical protein
LRLRGEHPLQQRQREGRRLAGAGGRLAEQVAAGEQRRNRLALDRGRLFVTEPGQHRDEFFRQPEFDEWRVHSRAAAGPWRVAG